MDSKNLATLGCLGDFPPLDGTIEFYGRVNALIKPTMTVLDLGASTALWRQQDQSEYRRSLRPVKGKVAKLIGADIDPAVFTNETTDENLLIENGHVPLPDLSVDMIICDYVLEHVEDPKALERETRRLLKPGGVFCGRTPHLWNYVSIGARIVSNARHGKFIKHLQPGRGETDFFPTCYRVNTMRQIAHIWRAENWANHSYLYASEPTYHFGSPIVYALLSLAHRILPTALTGNIFFFLVRKQNP
jgi:SAM-dependent methyltransferase